MPWNEVMPKFKRGELKSGGSGEPVKNPKQAVAIIMSEKRQAAKGKKEYEAHDDGGTVGKVKQQSRLPPTHSGPPQPPLPPTHSGPTPPMYGAPPTTRTPPTHFGSPQRPPINVPIPNTPNHWSVPDRSAPEGQVQPPPNTNYDISRMNTIKGMTVSPSRPDPSGGMISKGPEVTSPQPHYVNPANLSGGQAIAKGGSVMKKYNKGGEACPSNAKQQKENLAEAAANPTEKVKLAKGGEVKEKKAPWRRW